MKVTVVKGNILDVDAEALAVGVDGKSPRMVGNVAAQLMKRAGLDEKEGEDFEVFVERRHDPFTTHITDTIGGTEGLAFGWLIALDVVSHDDGADHEALLRRALAEMLEKLKSRDFRRIACPVLKGGWRMTNVRAAEIMQKAFDGARGLDKEIVVAVDRDDVLQDVRGIFR